MSLLDQKEKKKFIIIQILIIAMAMLELATIISIGPFLSVISTGDSVLENKTVQLVYQHLGCENWDDFILKISSLLILMFIVSMVVSIITTWKMSSFGAHFGANIGTRLYKHYLNSSWTFHLQNSNSYLTKQIATESARLSHAVIAPILQVNAKIVVLLVLISAIFIKNPLGTLFAVIIFSTMYLAIYAVSKNILKNNGRKITEIMAERFKLLNDGFGVVKEIILQQNQNEFVEKFKANGFDLAVAQTENQSISIIPKYIVEGVVFIGIALSALYAFYFTEVHSQDLLSEIIIYTFLGFKILPNVQQLYANISVVKGNLSSFYAISNDLEDSKCTMLKSVPDNSNILLDEFESLSFNNVSYRYPCKEKFAIRDVNLLIERNKIYGFVGHSGAGKSTIIDLLLGLINPSQGEIMVRSKGKDCVDYREFRHKVGLVPQDVKIISGTLRENIALGVRVSDIDNNKLKSAILASNLVDIVEQLDEGLDTKITEGGLNFSGGQKQRISIARALYTEPDILIFDEATSALDGISERKIMESINEISKNKTVVLVAHRLKTVERCDNIFLMEKGKIIGSGDFSKLQEMSKVFKEMVESS
ncbi:ABC transporter ATP-binding protein [Vibrio vulnificus]|uniref:ABC transporter ATP-binding protein n=1 Tax=Vibrio vulnificus TaxID=672 RepID=UPI00187D1D47|nr:ABC transporter ATP-binding protein [Vibrio vulnificus]